MITTAYTQMSIFFGLSLAFVFFLVRFIPGILKKAEQFGQLLSKCAFPGASDRERYKLAILRAAFGIVLLIRAINIQLLLLPEERLGFIGLVSFGDILASLLLILGLFTQPALLFFMFFMWHLGERVLGTSTLGNDVAAILSLLFLLTNAGKYFSLDSLLIKRYKKPGLLLYSEKTLNNEGMALVKGVALFAYWAVCLYSLSMHLNEPAWTNGTAGPLLLTNSFMSTLAKEIEFIFANNHWSVFFAKASMWAMMLWYVTLWPFVLLGGLWRKYAILWGILFFALSQIVLNLGSLAQIEFVFWAALFWSGLGLDNTSKILMFYDNKCNMCDKTVRTIRCLDLFKIVQFLPISSNDLMLQKHGISEVDALTDLHGIDERNGQVKAGYALYFLLVKRLVLLWPLLPLFWLGKVTGIGGAIYRQIAVRRRELLGVCTLSKAQQVSTSDAEPSKFFADSWQITVLLHACILTLIYLVLMPAPYIHITGIRNAATNAAGFYGVAPINVFNKTDLKMAENWFQLIDLDSGKELPVFTKEGARLYFHQSDRLYFGHTLQWRRKEIGLEDCAFERRQKLITYLSKVWLQQQKAEATTHHFRYVQYYRPLPADEALKKNIYLKQKLSTRCVKDFQLDYP